MESRLKRLAEKFGFKIVPTGCFINGSYTRRPDIMSLEYKHKHIMTIPKRIYGFPTESHKDLLGRQHPDYFDLEHKLRNWNYLIKTTNYLEDEDKKIAGNLY